MSDDDCGPDDVSFGVSKKEALESLKKTRELIQSQRLEKKEARKRQNELYTQQKEKKKAKIEKLEKLKVDSDFLANLPDELNQAAPAAAGEEDNDDDQEDIDQQIEKTTLHSKVNSVKKFEDYIALSTEKTDFKVLSLNDHRQLKNASLEALNFKSSKYNSPFIRRESAGDRKRRFQKYEASGNNIKA